MESWTKERKLGSGSYGTVFLASKDGSNPTLKAAVKSAEVDVPHAYRSLKLEAKFLAELVGKPNIVRCFGEDYSLESNKVIYNLFLELASGGTLRDLIRNSYIQGGKIPETLIACFARMILRGLAAIHCEGIAHCDLKPANILVFPVNGGICELKLADFGLARRVCDREKPQFFDGTKHHNRGTLLYSSPESVANGLHQTCNDVWAIGCIVAEMTTGNYVWNFKDTKGLIHQILCGEARISSDLSEDGVDFLRRCLMRDPRERWSVWELLSHPFIVKNMKIMSEIHGFDPNEKDRYVQKSPFGVAGWVSKEHLFSNRIWHALQQQVEGQQWRQQQEQQQEHAKQRHGRRNFQVPFGVKVIDLTGDSPAGVATRR